ncbi:prepilin peptidase [Guptibacillus hwajinpoensis]|uniref:prepilin peptidase n=1 Tax=Guptibacillus hwajinpoensis TaxID=208199 RepID=UPI001CFCDF4A|nr:A24 family peptidase [Pseudalkalibacillus hwajinpoensis]WLR60723.1 prepilin peptidase [Pseudalkalibacillus hwajinpoensis]
MGVILHSYLFLVGLALGSFYNVVGLRMPVKRSIVAPRSSCPTCERELSPLELVPVFSYLFQRGKCKGCASRISPIYAVVEFTTALLFTIAPFLVGWSKELVISYGLISLLVIIFVSDITYMLIPDRILLFFAAYFIVGRILVPMDPWYSPFIGAAGGFLLLLLIAVISKGGMGGGDIKLFAVLGFVFGYQELLLVFFFSTLCGTIIGVTALLTGRVKRKQHIPFGPSIVLGAIITYFYGEQILHWYISILL